MKLKTTLMIGMTLLSSSCSMSQTRSVASSAISSDTVLCSEEIRTNVNSSKPDWLSYENITCLQNGSFLIRNLKYLHTNGQKGLIRYGEEFGAAPKQSRRLCHLLGFGDYFQNTSRFTYSRNLDDMTYLDITMHPKKEHVRQANERVSELINNDVDVFVYSESNIVRASEMENPRLAYWQNVHCGI
jgi:hypothetical protein